MAGPIVTFATGNRHFTACAIRCEVECRIISRASGLFPVIIATFAPSGRMAGRSTRFPFILPASAALARPVPIAAARSRTVAPALSNLTEPSGSVTLMSLIYCPLTERGIEPRCPCHIFSLGMCLMVGAGGFEPPTPSVSS